MTEFGRILMITTVGLIGLMATACAPASSGNPFSEGGIYRSVNPPGSQIAVNAPSYDLRTLSGGELHHR